MSKGSSQRSPADDRQPIGPAFVALNLLTTALWGGTPVAVHYSVDQLPPIAVSGIRFALAAVFMLFWCRFEGASLPLSRRQLWPTLVLGLLLFGQIALFTVGIAMTNSSHSTVLINTFVFWVAGIEHFITRTMRYDGKRLLGLIFATAGGLIVLAISDSSAGQGGATARDPATLAGDLIVVGSAFLLGIKIVYTKHAAQTVPPGALIFWHDVIGVLLFAAWSLAFEDTTLTGLRAPTILALLYQGLIVAGFCFAVQAHLLRKHSASKISIFSVATPLFGIAAAWLFRGDPLSPWLVVSAVCVAAGILMVNLEPGESRAPLNPQDSG